MKKKIIFLFIVFSFFCIKTIFAKTIDEEISDISRQITEIENSITPLKKETKSLQSKITDAKKSIVSIENKVADLGQKIINKEADLEVQKLLLFERIRRYYINSSRFNPLLILFSSSEGSELLRQYSWYQSIISQDKSTIIQYSADIDTLNKNKLSLETEKNKLAAIKKDLESRFGFLSGEIKKAETYKAQLSQKQQQLIAQKLSSLNLPVSLGAGPLMCTDDRKVDPGFGTGFAFFTFGIPHHVGLNQYGAYGRAKAGQNYRDILNAYYNNVSIEKKPNITINVIGYGNKSLEEYMLGIYEVPGSWPMEALKAQAVAARSYALSYTNNGSKSICTTQACQVYKGGNKGGDWEKAVKETEGEVLVQNGQVVTAWFASTAGAYTFTSADVGWRDTPWTKRTRDTNGEINSWQDLFDKAYDRESPCFYSAQGYRKEYNKSAWLKPEEVADIVNVILLAQKDSSIQNHLYPQDRPNPSGTDTWNTDRVKTELKNRGGNPFNSINSASISDWNKNEGRVNTISLSGDAGSVNFDGKTFKDYFNLRAPANISIVGPLYNIEKR